MSYVMPVENCIRRGRRTRAALAPGGAALLSLLVATTMGGCHGGTVKPMTAEEIQQAARARGLPAIIVPFALTPEMGAWLEARVQKSGSHEERLAALALALLDPRGFHINYQRNFTGTAQDVFQTHQANCLSFTHLFIGMARELEVPVYFLEVRDVENYSREGDLVVISDHVAVGFGPPHDLRIIDFAEDAGDQYRRIHPISDLTAIALFYSNRGAEQLRSGKVDDAVRWLQAATRIDPDLAAAWVNLGVALRRNGDRHGAAASYRRALAVDSTTISAYHNLAALLRMEGHVEEAMELMALTDRGSNRNPFSYVALGDLNMRFGRMEDAARFYRKAVRLDAESPEPYAAMGLYRLEAGEPVQARRWLKKARRFDPDDADSRVALLASRLERARD